MILSVMMLGGVLISIGVIAGVLVTYQIRQANDVEDSAKAFFAADTGIEWQTYDIYVASVPPPELANGASFIASSSLSNGNVVIRVQGFSGDAVRALDSGFIAPLSIQNFTATPPTVLEGGSTNLSWNSVNASNCILFENGAIIGEVPLVSAGYAVFPPGAAPGSALYELTCSETSGASVTSSITVPITFPA